MIFKLYFHKRDYKREELDYFMMIKVDQRALLSLTLNQLMMPGKLAVSMAKK